MKTRRIRKVAVLGSGLMGSSLACHFAGCGFEVILLDLPSAEPDRNQIPNLALEKCLKVKPSNIYHQEFKSRITTGNFEDDLFRIKDCDWILEAIIENLDIKKKLYESIERYRTEGSLISSNTSGIPISLLIQGRSSDFKQNFLGTHFFNPPRYLSLLELIPSEETNPELILFVQDFAWRLLGKKTIVCKDSPAFVANRIGVAIMANIYTLASSLDLSISEVDGLTGSALGRPKSGTFRLSDLVGLDTALMVIEGLKKNCPQDSFIQNYQLPEFLTFLKNHQWYGNKSGKGFYYKSSEKDHQGKSKVLELNLKTLQYQQSSKTSLESLDLAKKIDDLPRRIQTILKCQDKGADLVKKSLGFLFYYCASKISEICDQTFMIDQAIKNGFGWEIGPFELWQSLSFDKGIQLIVECGYEVPEWILKMKDLSLEFFYNRENNTALCLDPKSMEYVPIPVQGVELILKNNQADQIVYQNPEIRLHDIGDGVLCLEFTSKHNAIGEGILRGIQESIRIGEEQGWKGLVIGNDSKNFTVGANLMLIGMLAFQQEFDTLDQAVRLFQQTSMRCRYSSIPLVCATQGYCFGGGTELLMHCDAAVCAVESYIGLVEVGVGLIPGGGGTKEFALRFSNQITQGEVMIPQLIQHFKTIALASVATSAYEAFDFGYLQHARDRVSINGFTQIYQAKQRVLELSPYHIQPIPPRNITVLGQTGLGTLNAAAHSLHRAGFASDHDLKVAKKIAYVLCGGDLSGVEKVDEQYLLDLEREAFLSLCGEPKTLERIQHMLETNKPLRN